MRLDLDSLKAMHPLLPAAVARSLSHSAAVALRRQGHEPSTELMVTDRGIPIEPRPELTWSPTPTGATEMVDRNRTTEDGAEAVALALSAQIFNWTIRRRLQRGESADWLLADADGSAIALEVSGIDGPFDNSRLVQKAAQVGRVRFASVKVACVIAFERPEAKAAQS